MKLLLPTLIILQVISPANVISQVTEIKIRPKPEKIEQKQIEEKALKEKNGQDNVHHFFPQLKKPTSFYK